jgi:UDP-N-acetylmuramate-alanine ligase
LLAHFVNSAEHAIAVSGTHGKSTTSAMIAHILVECGFSPTALLGAVYPPFGSNVRLGDPNLVVVEA